MDAILAHRAMDRHYDFGLRKALWKQATQIWCGAWFGDPIYLLSNGSYSLWGPIQNQTNPSARSRARTR